MRLLSLVVTVTAIAVCLLIASCAPTAPVGSPPAAPAGNPPSEPAKAPAQPTVEAAPAAPTKAPASTIATQPTAAPAAAKKTGFPSEGKAISIIEPLAPGGGADIQYRLMAAALEKELRTPVQVFNKPGAAGQVAATDLVRSKPDGYTLLDSTFITLMLSYLDAERKSIYGRKDFQPVARITTEANLVVVGADSPFKTMKDLIDAVKANPEKVKVGTTGLKGTPHIAGLTLENVAKVKFSFVHFDGSAPATAALLGGHIDVTFITPPSVMSLYKDGKVRLLGYMDEAESAQLPGVKTLEAQGYKVYSPVVHGLAAPAGTPREVVDILSAATKRAMETDEVKKRFVELGLTARYQDPEAYSKYWDQTDEMVKQALAALNENK